MVSGDRFSFSVRRAGAEFDQQLVGSLLVRDDLRESLRRRGRQRLRSYTNRERNDQQTEVRARPSKAACHSAFSLSAVPGWAFLLRGSSPKATLEAKFGLKDKARGPRLFCRAGKRGKSPWCLVLGEEALEEAGFVSVDEAQRLFFAEEAVDA
jgi:hypothetical protein